MAKETPVSYVLLVTGLFLSSQQKVWASKPIKEGSNLTEVESLVPEHYRKESAYIDVNEDLIEKPKEPKIEKIREEVSAQLSTDSVSSSASASTISSASSVVRTNPSVEQISTTPDVHQDEPAKRVRLDSTSSSSSSENENMSEQVSDNFSEQVSHNFSEQVSDNFSENMSEDLPKYQPRKSSFSSPSEVEPDKVVIFGEEPGESTETDDEKLPKKGRPDQFESSDSDSDSSASEASFHIDHTEFVRPTIVRKDSKTESSEPESESPAPARRDSSDSEPEIRSVLASLT